MSEALYEHDFHAWTQRQAAALRRAAAEGVVDIDIDWENLAEEIESLGRSELHAMESALMRIIEHLLKLAWSPARDPRLGWMESVTVHRVRFAKLSRDNPGLVNRLNLAEIYADARKLARSALTLRDGLPASALPLSCPFMLEQIVDDDWYPPHGALSTHDHGGEG